MPPNSVPLTYVEAILNNEEAHMPQRRWIWRGWNHERVSQQNAKSNNFFCELWRTHYPCGASIGSNSTS